MSDYTILSEAIKTRSAMEKYQDTIYLKMIRTLNENCQAVLKQDLGTQFIHNCGRDIAGEVVRNCFNTSDYHLTVDQLARRILEFTYENEYDPLGENGGVGEVAKAVYNYNERNSAELDNIINTIEQSQTQLFTEDRKQDRLDREGKVTYRESKRNQDGKLYDELTGVEEERKTRRDGVKYGDLHADHVQAREAASYSARYITETGKSELKLFWNSADNMQLMHASANTSKGDIRVCSVDGKIVYVNARSKEYDPSTDITYKATPEELADATISQWESREDSREGKENTKIEKLKEKGYLDENGKVPKAVRKELIRNIRHSQNVESKIVLQNTNYGQVAKDAVGYTKASIGKIIAGQIIYYAAPPIVYEVRTIIADKTIKLDNALEKLGQSLHRVGDYVFHKLKDIFKNILANSLKKFIKSFMDILINLVKATVKKLLKMAKNLVLSTVDAVRIIASEDTSRAEKADAVMNLYAVTITSCVVELLFEMAEGALHIPPPFDDIIFGPLQILATVICTNLTLLILQKADLFDVRRGFRMSQIRELFASARENYEKQYDDAMAYADEQVAWIIEAAKQESLAIYENLSSMDMKKDSVREELEKINQLFSIGIEFESDWLCFIGITGKSNANNIPVGQIVSEEVAHEEIEDERCASESMQCDDASNTKSSETKNTHFNNSNEKNINHMPKIGHGFVHRRTPAKIDGAFGYLVWDYVLYNEITFDDMNGNSLSFFTSFSDKATEKQWDELVRKYGV